MKDNRIRRVMNESLSAMVFTDQLKRKVLIKTKGEIAVKRKLSVGLIFAMIMILMVGIALAVWSMRDTARQVIETEQAQGYYQDWPLENKLSLVNALVKLSYIEETAQIKPLLSSTLTDNEASRAADEALVAFTGREVTEISFMEIMQAAWGPFDRWTKEEQAWYSQLMIDMGLQGQDHTLYVEPINTMSEKTAIGIARREIARGFDVEENTFDTYQITTSYQIPEFSKPGDTQPYWYVEFMTPDSVPYEQKLFNGFWVFIHPDTGELIEPIEKMVADYQYNRDMQDAINNDPLVQELGVFWKTYGYQLENI